MFKVCLDYWNHLVCDLFQSECSLDQPPPTFGFQHLGATMPTSGRKQLYAMPMSRLRLLMISRMAKPEEVIVVEDENGNIVREVLKDSDVLAQYKQMRETLVYLSHLDHADTQSQVSLPLPVALGDGRAHRERCSDGVEDQGAEEALWVDSTKEHCYVRFGGPALVRAALLS